MSRAYYATVEEKPEGVNVIRIDAADSRGQAHESAFGLEEFLVSVGQSTRDLTAIHTYALPCAEERWPREIADYIGKCRYYTFDLLTGEKTPERQGLMPLE